MLAAKLDRQVIAVEPFIDHVRSFHKAATIEKAQHKITLINKALSNDREFKLLARNGITASSRSLLHHRLKKYERLDTENKFLVQTILMDDLLDYLPKKEDGSDFRRAIMKIDVTGFEPFVFQKANNLLDTLDVRSIYMSWHSQLRDASMRNEVQDMVNLLGSKGYKPYFFDIPLNETEFDSWSYMVKWIKV